MGLQNGTVPIGVFLFLRKGAVKWYYTTQIIYEHSF